MQPAVSDNLSVGYTWKKYLVSVSYTKEDGSIAGFQPQSDSVTNKLVLSPENLVNRKTGSLVLSVPVTVVSWWTMQYNITGLWQEINALYKGTPLRKQQVNLSFNGTERFVLPKDFSLEVTGNYQSPLYFGWVKTKSMGSLDIGGRKKLPGKAGLLTVNAINILDTGKFRTTVNLPEQNLVQTLNMIYGRPALKLTYTRNFGKEKLKQKRERATGAEEEKGRVQ